jgi:hypothetical protein
MCTMTMVLRKKWSLGSGFPKQIYVNKFDEMDNGVSLFQHVGHIEKEVEVNGAT